MGTAIQDLIEVVRKRRDFMEDEGYKEAMQDVLLIALNLIKAEKEQIMEAYNFGYRDGFHDAQSCVSDEKDVSEFANAKQYYQQTFKSGE